MKFGLLFKKTSTCYSDPDIEYLDETSEKKMEIEASKHAETLEECLEKSNQVLKDIDYLTKEEYGKVYAAGWIRDGLLERNAIGPDRLDNEVRKTKITEQLSKTKPYRGAVGHKLIFSVSEELQEKVESAGLNLDEILKTQAKRIMIEFQEKFHPNDKIGFAFGIHHDTDNRHMHLFLSNRTKNGHHVAMSNPLKNHTNRKYEQKDQIGFIKQRAVVSQLRILRQVEKKIKNVEKLKIKEIKIKPQTIEERVMENKQKRKTSGSHRFKSITEETLELQEKILYKKQKEILKKKDEARELWAEYSLRKHLIDSGVSNIQNINRIISGRYGELKKCKRHIPAKLLRDLGYLSNNSQLKFLAKAINTFENANNDEQRKKLLEEINVSKEIKSKIVNQLDLHKKERNRFLDMIKEVKKETARKEKLFYKNLAEYRRKLDQHNLQKFLDNTSNKKIRYEYFAILKSLKEKKKQGKDVTKEKDYIFHLKRFVKSEYESSTTSDNYVRQQHSFDVKAQQSKNDIQQTKNVSLKERSRMSQQRFNPNSSLLRDTKNDKGIIHE